MKKQFAVLAIAFTCAAQAILLNECDADCHCAEENVFAQVQGWEDKAEGPQDGGWFKSDTYQAKSAADKLTDLWGMIE